MLFVDQSKFSHDNRSKETLLVLCLFQFPNPTSRAGYLSSEVNKSYVDLTLNVSFGDTFPARSVPQLIDFSNEEIALLLIGRETDNSNLLTNRKFQMNAPLCSKQDDSGLY